MQTIYYWRESRVQPDLSIVTTYKPIDLVRMRKGVYYFAKDAGGTFPASQHQLDIWLANGQMKVERR